MEDRSIIHWPIIVLRASMARIVRKLTPRDRHAAPSVRASTSLLICVGLVMALSGCGKGVDAKLSTTNDVAYRASLNRAWVDMSAEQQLAYNWAVRYLSIEQLVAKYPSITPRRVVNTEADDHIALKTQELVTITAELAKNAERFDREDKSLREVSAELAKVNATGVGIKAATFGFGRTFVFVTKNDSRFDISSARWNAWLFIDGEQRSERHCALHAFYKVHGGLPRGESLEYAFNVGFMDCRNWDTLEVRNATKLQFKLELDPASVEDFGEKTILPHFPLTRARYEKAMVEAKGEIEIARNAKATLP